MQTLAVKLPPPIYRLYLPTRGVYIRAFDAPRSLFTTTNDAARALRLPEPQALAEARELIGTIGQTIELRQVEPQA